MTPGDLPPANDQGERELTYKHSGLLVDAALMLIFAAIWLTIIAWMMYFAVTEKPGPRSTPPQYVIPALLAFGAIGVALVITAIAYIKAAKNERIILTRTEIIWIDRNGAQRVKATFDQIRNTQEANLAQPAPGRSSRMHHKCIVETAAGKIVFSDNIDNYEALKRFCLNAPNHT